MLSALIMAGGKGTRFWPKSTEDKPKQFLSLVSQKTMLQLTVDRCLKLMAWENIFVCTSEKYFRYVKEQLPELPVANIILEPVGRNTAPCILLSTIYIQQKFVNTDIIVLPSDHVINDLSAYSEIIRVRYDYLKSNESSIITLGIKPRYPETGYGYIKYIDSENKIKQVDSFVEKPNIDKAEEYINAGNYLWNAGMFMFNSDYLISISKIYMRDTYQLLSKLPLVASNNYYECLKEIYRQCESISFDYAVAEKCKEMFVIISDIGWDDIGSWKALERYLNKDLNGNIMKTPQLFINSHDNLVYTDKQVLFVDIDGLVCIESDDIMIVTKQENINMIHTLKEHLK